jgi:hypothetical protein
METSLDMAADSRGMASGFSSDVVRSARGKFRRATKPQLLTRSQLDGRTNAAKVFDRLVSDIEGDLGGADQLSTIERALVEAFAGATVMVQFVNTRLALGEQVDPSEACSAVSAMVRIASRLGVSRRARDVGQISPLEYAREFDDADEDRPR